MSYPKNNPSPPVYDVGCLIQISDGAIQTSGESVRVKIGTGAWGAGAGTAACDATSGIYTYTPSQAETNAESFVVAIYKTGCVSISRTVVTSASATAGYQGVDWSKVTAPTTTLNLSGTTIKTATDVEADTADIQAKLNTLYAATVVATGTVGATRTTTSFFTNLTQANNYWNDAQIVFTSGNMAGIPVVVSSFFNANGEVITAETMPSTPDVGITFSIVARHTHSTAAIAAATNTAVEDGAVGDNVLLLLTNVDEIPTNAELATSQAGLIASLAIAHGAGSWATATGFSTHSASDVWAVGTRTITGGSLTTSPPTAAAIADAVWDEATSGHSTAGTYGKSVTDEQTKASSILDTVSYILSAEVGACADAGTSAETYVLTVNGSTYTIDHTGLDATGNRGTVTLTKS